MNKQKDPGLAAVLSFLMTGLGQFYNEEFFKGIILIIIQVVNTALCFVYGIGLLLLPLIWLLQISDAYVSAKNINRENEESSEK